MKIKYTFLLAGLMAFTACNDPEDVDLSEEIIVAELPELISGDADFSNYVSLGNSLTAGFTDGALFAAGQNNSIPNILAKNFEQAGGGTFTQPLMNDNTGGLLLRGTQILPNRLVFNGSGPARLETVIPSVAPKTDLTSNPSGPFNNMGVPGAKSFHLFAPDYGSVENIPLGLANPYYVRMASSPNASIVSDAIAQNPTFFTLWIGNNDVLGYATSGGDGSNPITPLEGPAGVGFEATYGSIVGALTAGGAKGVVANIPKITTIPFFTTVPNNALVLDEGAAASLTGFFQAVSGIFLQGLLQQMVPLEQAQALASQYVLTFNEGPNRFLIDVPVSQTNPLGFRQMNEDELLLLTIDQGALAKGYGSVVLSNDVLQVLGLLQAGGTPTPEQAGLVLAAVSGIDDKDVLDSIEITEINTATTGFNSVIETVAAQAGLGLVDASGLLNQLFTSGLSSDGFTLSSSLVTGGAFSLDGVHSTARGYALIANEFLKVIDNTYGSNFQVAGQLNNIGNFPTNYSPALP